MKLARVGKRGNERPVVSEDGSRWFDVEAIVDDYDGTFFGTGGIALVKEALAAGVLQPTDISGERVGAPVVRPPSVLCIGMNYAAHAAESGSAPPSEVVVFFKKNNTLVGPRDEIFRPRDESTLDWEVELGIVIGERMFGNVSPERAMASVAGYLVANDLSDRWLQLERSGGQWSKGKSFPASCSLGPWLSTADEIPDPQNLRLTSWVNGEARQDSTTADMVFPVAKILTELAGVMMLEPGDLILTGTPEGVALSGRFPYLGAGDSVRMSIDGLGEIHQVVVEHIPEDYR